MTQFATAKDGVEIAYEVVGEGLQTVMLVHGFASDRKQNWKIPGWYDTLSGAGYRVVALDNRGHGESDKPYDPASYSHEIMSDDVLAVMADADLGEALLMGYSMGGYISMSLLLRHPERFSKVVIAGVGASYLDINAAEGAVADPQRRSAVADALLVDDPSTITNRTAREFRAFADQAGKDRKALAACMRGSRDVFTREQLAHSQRPVLVVCGEKDVLTGPPDPLAAAFADGRAVTVPNRDHMTAVGDKVYKAAVLEFFKE
ncbi:MAG TPA: alpha/beta hydrolase [Rhizomicrobium sp.]|jgi:pimeloyl-ACP methyl ester carboxylesterase